LKFIIFSKGLSLCEIQGLATSATTLDRNICLSRKSYPCKPALADLQGILATTGKFEIFIPYLLAIYLYATLLDGPAPFTVGFHQVSLGQQLAEEYFPVIRRQGEFRHFIGGLIVSEPFDKILFCLNSRTTAGRFRSA
jgi:hypothetical protein